MAPEIKLQFMYSDLPQFCYDRFYSNDNASADDLSELNIEEYHGKGLCIYLCICVDLWGARALAGTGIVYTVL